MPEQPKPLIGVLTSHDSREANDDLAKLFDELYRADSTRLEKFHFVFTGGTFDRILLGRGENPSKISNPAALNSIRKRSTRLPGFAEGGVILLANLVVQRQTHMVWPFHSPASAHWLSPENLALMRLVDFWRDKRSMTPESVRNWFYQQAEADSTRNQQNIPLCLYSDSDDKNPVLARATRRPGDGYGIDFPQTPPLKCKTLALIAHDEMKPRVVDVALEFENELAANYGRILTTGTTGHQIMNATRKLKDKIKLCRSGPKGGDAEIATEILFRRVDHVLFFIDPLHPHAHIDDVRTVFAACMRRPNVLLFTNEVQAREWLRTI